MGAPTQTPRRKWIEEGLRALGSGGPDAVRIEALAQALGVTKGGFYGHFKDRQALLDEMLDTWERASTDEVLERVERKGGDARAKLQRAGALTFSGCLLPIDLAVRDRSPSASNGSTTSESTTCALCSAPSAPTKTTSRLAACSPSHWSSATTSWPPITARAAAPRYSTWP